MRFWQSSTKNYCCCLYVLQTVLFACVVLSPAQATEPQFQKFDSQQLRNPARVGLLCGATFTTVCPETFPNDVVRVDEQNRRFFSPANIDFVQAHATKAYEFWRHVGAFASSSLLMFFAVWLYKKRKAKTNG